MRYLVTGGAGFIGSNLVKYLSDLGCHVTVLDNFHTGSRDNLKDLNVKVINGEPSDFDSDFYNKFDGIFHIGIPSSSPMYRDNPKLVGRAINDFIHLRENYDGKIVMASSSSVYNDIETPHRETDNIKPLDWYTEARLAMERLAALYYKMYDKETVMYRMFSVYGPYEEAKEGYANMVSQFLWAIENDDEVVVYGDGSQTRDFVYVKDVIKWYYKAMVSDISFDIINLGTGESYTFNEVIELIKDKLNKDDISIRCIENPIKHYVQHTKADNSKLYEIDPDLADGFKSLDEGLDELIANR